MNKKTQFKVVLVKNIRKDGTYPIKIRYTENRKSYFQNTGFNIKEYEWHNAKSQVNSRHPEYQKINQEIELMMQKNMSACVAHRFFVRPRCAENPLAWCCSKPWQNMSQWAPQLSPTPTAHGQVLPNLHAPCSLPKTKDLSLPCGQM